jgi:hypothetical protein
VVQRSFSSFAAASIALDIAVAMSTSAGAAQPLAPRTLPLAQTAAPAEPRRAMLFRDEHRTRMEPVTEAAVSRKTALLWLLALSVTAVGFARGWTRLAAGAKTVEKLRPVARRI